MTKMPTAVQIRTIAKYKKRKDYNHAHRGVANDGKLPKATEFIKAI
jgi:hypothetical protein